MTLTATWATALDKWTVFQAYRRHRTEPAAFYAPLAADAARGFDERFGLRGATVLDLGCGPGWYLDAMRDRGAVAFGVEMSADELFDRPIRATDTLLGDGTRLPFATGSFDGVMCSNMLEHTPNPELVLDEIARVLRPGGWAYVSWTPWYSPWGGHDMNPYQYLGPTWGPRLYERLHGVPRKNRYGEGLWAIHVGRILKAARSMPTLAVDKVEARYWPALSALLRVPGLREVAVGNCALILHRTPVKAATTLRTRPK